MTEKSEKNWFKRHKILTIVLAFLAFSIISGAASGGEKPADNSTGKSTTSTAQKSETAAEKQATPPEPKVYQGTGDDVLDIQKPADGPAIVAFECPACTNNTIVKTNGAESLLVNMIGGYTGSHLIDISSGSNTTQVTVTASGAWKVTVSGLDKATPVNGQPVTGQGDSVLYVSGKTTKAALANSGDANFIVNVHPEGGGFPDLAVNTIGSYKGTVPLKTPAYVQITSNGSWSITPN